MTREQVNIFACGILDTLEADGIPEGHLTIAAMSAGIDNPAGAINLLVSAGLLRRLGGHIIGPGRVFEKAKAAMLSMRRDQVKGSPLPF